MSKNVDLVFGNGFKEYYGKNKLLFDNYKKIYNLPTVKSECTSADIGLTKRDRKNGWGHMSAAPILHATTNTVQSIIYDRMF